MVGTSISPSAAKAHPEFNRVTGLGTAFVELRLRRGWLVQQAVKVFLEWRLRTWRLEGCGFTDNCGRVRVVAQIQHRLLDSHCQVRFRWNAQRSSVKVSSRKRPVNLVSVPVVLAVSRGRPAPCRSAGADWDANIRRWPVSAAPELCLLPGQHPAWPITIPAGLVRTHYRPRSRRRPKRPGPASKSRRLQNAPASRLRPLC